DADAAPGDSAAEREAEREPAAGLPRLPLLDDALDHAEVERKPSWRGWIHAGTFPVAIAAGVVLIVLADRAAADWASAAVMTTALVLFGITAVYPRINWSPKVKALFRRLDHANIFLLIAGTYTPLAVCALPGDKALVLLSIVWGGALLGIGFRVFWLKAPRWLYVPLYLALGWAAMMYSVDLLQAILAMMVLVIVGGVAYTGGAE